VENNCIFNSSVPGVIPVVWITAWEPQT